MASNIFCFAERELETADQCCGTVGGGGHVKGGMLRGGGVSFWGGSV